MLPTSAIKRALSPVINAAESLVSTKRSKTSPTSANKESGITVQKKDENSPITIQSDEEESAVVKNSSAVNSKRAGSHASSEVPPQEHARVVESSSSNQTKLFPLFGGPGKPSNSKLKPQPNVELDLTLERDTMDGSWFEPLKAEFNKPYFATLKAFVESQYKSATVYPPISEVYAWSRLTPLNKVKVVILGQDPYHGPSQAHGLAFSVNPGVSIPPSLRNMYKELSDNYPDIKKPISGDLRSWASQGVLMLNTALTVRKGEAASHSKKGWEDFTKECARLVVNSGRDVVFMAWGAPSLKVLSPLLAGKTHNHLLLSSAHPSPLSAHRGFLGNGHFKKANDWLEKRYGEGQGIDWGSVGNVQ